MADTQDGQPVGGPEPDWFQAERSYDDEVIGETTIPELFEASADRYADRPAQGYKGGIYDRSLTPGVLPAPEDGEFATITYEEMREVVRNLAAGFRDLGVTAGDRVALFCDTRMEWAQCDFALLAAGAVVTTVYTESAPNHVEYLLDDPGATGVVVENEELLGRVREVEDRLDLEFVVSVDELTTADDDVHTLAAVHDRGAERFDEDAYRGWIDERNLEDLASLIYTSGTTGWPKGVELTHRNFRANVNQTRKRFGPRPDRADDVPVLDAGTTTLSFLPLAHVFERTAGHFLMFASGATVNYAESADTVREDIKAVRPNVATSVPRVYERIFASMRDQASGSSVKERIFEWATSVARRYSRADDPGQVLQFQHSLADQLVYSEVREQLGGNVEILISGGGSLPEDIARLFDGMGLTIYEGYGLTEAAPVVSVNPPEDPRPGTLGPPLVDVEIKLDRTAVPEEQQRRAAGEVGELLVRGPNVTRGYWRMEKATRETITDDGWLHTGDIVERTDDDYLVYHDRLKQLFVLSTGTNVAPGPIEDHFRTSERIDQIMVMGDDEKFVSALIVPDFEAVEAWADREGVDLPDDRTAICRDERVLGWIEEEVARINQRFETHERIKRFGLVPTEWTPENDMLTPSMKLKRRNIIDEYDQVVGAIYDDASAATERTAAT